MCDGSLLCFHHINIQYTTLFNKHVDVGQRLNLQWTNVEMDLLDLCSTYIQVNGKNIWIGVVLFVHSQQMHIIFIKNVFHKCLTFPTHHSEYCFQHWQRNRFYAQAVWNWLRLTHYDVSGEEGENREQRMRDKGLLESILHWQEQQHKMNERKAGNRQESKSAY